MLNSQRFFPLFLLSSAVFAACGQGTAGDPKTVVKGDLNPPFGLVSVTREDELDLIFNISNTESDLIGYNVYVAEGAVDDLKALITSTSALKSKNLLASGLPRCDDTKDMFAKFGFDKTDDLSKKKCESLGVPEASATASASGATTSTALTGTNRSSNAEAATVASKFVACYDKDNQALGDAKTLSISLSKAVDPSGALILDASGDRKKLVGKRVRCRVPGSLAGVASKLSDGKEGITKGKAYVAFAVAVAGEKANKISWASNFAEEMPVDLQEFASLELGNDKYAGMTWDSSTKIISSDFTSQQACGAADQPQDCRLFRDFSLSTGDALANAAGKYSIYVADEAKGATNTSFERIFVAGETLNSTKKVYLLKRNARPDIDGQAGLFTPGETPAAFTASQYESGKMLSGYPGDLFDVAVDMGGTYNYGKLYISSIASNGDALNSAKSKTIKIYWTMQPVASKLFTFWDKRIAVLPVGIMPFQK